MDRARERGMSDPAIEAAIGFPVRTAHRWASNDIGPKGPTADLVFKFCDGLGQPRSKAMSLLDWAEDDLKPSPPEPTAPPEFRELMRRLNDPNVPKREKDHIRETLKDLIARPRPKTGSAGKSSRAAE